MNTINKMKELPTKELTKEEIKEIMRNPLIRPFLELWGVSQTASVIQGFATCLYKARIVGIDNIVMRTADIEVKMSTKIDKPQEPLQHVRV